MPIVNTGNAPNLFAALKSSLSKHGLDLFKSLAFMSDTTSVMKGGRSGVQKLIKKEHPSLYDVGCICHLANHTIKAGLESLPVDNYRPALCGRLLLLLPQQHEEARVSRPLVLSLYH